MGEYWSDEDEGLCAGLRLLEYLQHHDKLIPAAEAAPQALEPHEQHLGSTDAWVYQYVPVKIPPDQWHSRHYGYSWKRDPFIALFWWVIMLPLNLLLREIGRQRAATTQLQWRQITHGPLTITQHGFVQAKTWKPIRVLWTEIQGIDLDRIYAPGASGALETIRVTTTSQVFNFYVPTLARTRLYVTLRYLALGDKSTSLYIPEGFQARARSAGKQC